jgi:hypothetical protein
MKEIDMREILEDKALKKIYQACIKVYKDKDKGKYPWADIRIEKALRYWEKFLDQQKA